MFQPVNVRATIDSLNANVAVLDHAGQVVQVNEGWRRFGARRKQFATRPASTVL